MIAMVPIMATVTASHFGQWWRCKNWTSGTRRAAIRIAIMNGTTISRRVLTRKMTSPASPATSSRRQENAAAIRRAGGTDAAGSELTTGVSTTGVTGLAVFRGLPSAIGQV